MNNGILGKAILTASEFPIDAVIVNETPRRIIENSEAMKRAKATRRDLNKSYHQIYVGKLFFSSKESAPSFV